MKLKFYLRLVVSIFGIYFSVLPRSGAITLEEAYKSAILKTESVPFAQSQLRGSEARVDEVKGNFLPSLSASVIYQNQEKEMTALRNRDQATGKLTLSQSLLAGGRDKADLAAASKERKAQEYNLTNSKNALYVLVARSFYALLAANKEVENTSKSIELTKKRIQELRKRKKIGKSRNIEVSAADAQQAILEAQLLAAIGDSRIAKNNFANITGLDRDTALDDTHFLPNEVSGLQNYLSAVEKRPDILSLHALVESQEFNIDSAKAGHWPTLDLTGNYYPYRYRLIQEASTWDASLVLSIPLFSGGIVQAQVREAAEKKAQVELQLRQKQRDSVREIHSAYNTLKSAVEQVKALEKAVAATELNYREQEKDYRFSLATNLDVIQALNTYHDTKQTLDRTRYQALSAVAELKAAANQIEP